MSDEIGASKYFIPILMFVVFVSGIFALYGLSTGIITPQTQIIDELSTPPTSTLDWIGYVFTIPFMLIGLIISFPQSLIQIFGNMGYIFAGIGFVFIIVIVYVLVKLGLEIMSRIAEWIPF